MHVYWLPVIKPCWIRFKYSITHIFHGFQLEIFVGFYNFYLMDWLKVIYIHATMLILPPSHQLRPSSRSPAISWFMKKPPARRVKWTSILVSYVFFFAQHVGGGGGGVSTPIFFSYSTPPPPFPVEPPKNCIRSPSKAVPQSWQPCIYIYHNVNLNNYLLQST